MEYKFRGKRKSNGEWVYGSLIVEHDGDCHIVYWVSELVEPENNLYEPVNKSAEVAPETVGMLTALVDKNGKKIYEGDIVKFHYFYQSLGANLGAQESEHELIGVVKWADYGWSISAIKGQHWEGYTGYKSGEGESYIVNLYSMSESSIHEESFEVIGNIHDHPHLLNPAKGAVINTMNTDPNLQPASEAVQQEPTTEQVAAVEQEAQEQAMDSAEGAEG